MRCWLLLLVACRREPAPPVFGVAAELRGEVTLVAGTSRFALHVDERWYESERGALVERAVRVPREGEVFLGKTPIVIAGEEHAETKFRITPARVAIDTPYVPTQIETLADGREIWAYTEALVSNVMVDLVPMTPLARTGPVPPDLSPVRARVCEHPALVDLSASATAAYALFLECDPNTARRLVEIGGGETRLPSRAEVPLSSEKLAGRVLVGVEDGKLAIMREGKRVRHGAATRVLRAISADDGAVWTHAIDGNGAQTVARDGVPVELGAPPVAIARDTVLGVVVLAGARLYAERPPAKPLTIP